MTQEPNRTIKKAGAAPMSSVEAAIGAGELFQAPRIDPEKTIEDQSSEAPVIPTLPENLLLNMSQQLYVVRATMINIPHPNPGKDRPKQLMNGDVVAKEVFGEEFTRLLERGAIVQYYGPNTLNLVQAPVVVPPKLPKLDPRSPL